MQTSPAALSCLPAAELHPSSLVFVALWGLLDSALAAACGGAVGAWVDRQPRLAAASRMYLLQNICVAASAATALALLLSGARSGMLYWLGLAVTMAAGSASTLGALGSTLSGQHSRAQQGIEHTKEPMKATRQPACCHGPALAAPRWLQRPRVCGGRALHLAVPTCRLHLPPPPAAAACHQWNASGLRPCAVAITRPWPR